MPSLTRAQRRALEYIEEYVEATGKTCFTYNSLQRFWPRAKTRININTLERRLRELKDLGLLERHVYRDERGRERAYYCLPGRPGGGEGPGGVEEAGGCAGDPCIARHPGDPGKLIVMGGGESLVVPEAAVVSVERGPGYVRVKTRGGMIIEATPSGVATRMGGGPRPRPRRRR